MAQINETDMKLSVHEAVCAERYAGINARLKRLEQIMIASAGAIILLLIGVVTKVH